jgi:NADH-quinone oxidoreductase subunit C
MKTVEEISEILRNSYPDIELPVESGETGTPWIRVPASAIKDVSKILRDDEKLRFDTLMCLSGLHYPAERELGVTYHVHSTSKKHSLSLKVRVPEENPEIPSIESIWKTADWHEREAYDMVGILFTGHPDLRRILCPNDWEGHPLRKDYAPQEFYRGVTTGDKTVSEQHD